MSSTNAAQLADIPADDIRLKFPSPEPVFAQLKALNFNYELHEHVPVLTVEASQAATSNIEGTHIKNLFLRDKKRRCYLVVAEENTLIDIKSLKPILGAQGSLSFANTDLLWEVLGVRQGSVSPLALINDPENRIEKVLIDKKLTEAELVNPHPLRSDMTLTMSSQNLLTYMRHFGHEVEVVDF